MSYRPAIECPKGYVKLDLNESPTPPPPTVIRRAYEELSAVNRYPSAKLVEGLVEALADYSGVGKDYVALGCGSDGLLPVLALIAGASGGVVAFPRYSFSMYRAVAEASGAKVITIGMYPSGDEWRLDAQELLDAAGRANLLIIDNPNNPTGSLLVNESLLEEVVASSKGLVVVDEAYYEFSGITMASLVESYDNLVVLRTLSKAFSLAGLRVGYAIAKPRVAAMIRRLYPFPTSTPSLAAAAAALRDRGYVEDTVRRIRAERERVRTEVSKVGAVAYKSHANFLLIDTRVEGAADKLRDMCVLVRKVDISNTMVRVTIGLKEDNDLFLSSLKNVLRQYAT